MKNTKKYVIIYRAFYKILREGELNTMNIFTEIKKVITEFVASMKDNLLSMSPWQIVVNVMDILIMSLLLFAVYKFISKRRAGQLAVGVVLVILLAVISSVTGMRGINFILSNFYQVGILAIIIVFQPELRAALEKVGGNPIMTGIKNITMESKNLAEVTEATEELVNAMCDLSKSKTGAIVVIENTTKLGEYIQSGKLVDAKIGAELLKNIFYNKAPLHDGAVIVRDLRILAASCFLPLTTHGNTLGRLGSRHRAALGISENSDALVLVVSEETGTISVAYQGELTRQYSRDKLYEVVLSFFTQQNVKSHLKKSRKIRKTSSVQKEATK